MAIRPDCITPQSLFSNPFITWFTIIAIEAIIPAINMLLNVVPYTLKTKNVVIKDKIIDKNAKKATRALDIKIKNPILLF